MSWQDIPGWFAFAHAYDEMVETAKDGDTIVEVGVAFGRSVAYLARKVIDSGKDIRVVAIDPWLPRWDEHPRYPERLGWGGEHAGLVADFGGPFNAFLHMMMTHAPRELERIHVMRGTSFELCNVFDDGVRGVLIDAAHTYDEVASDIGAWKERIVRGGIIAGDDYQAQEFPGVVKAVHEAFGDNVEVKGTTWLRRM